MSDSFRLVALPAEQFRPLFEWSDEELKHMGARRVVVDSKPGAPCRVSLTDAEIGETVLLLPFVHHDVPTPYRGSSPIFIRQGVRTATPAVNEIPAMFRPRLLSVRAYDSSGMLLDSEVVQGPELEATIRSLFADASADYLHIHNAAPGCFNCRVVRA